MPSEDVDGMSRLVACVVLRLPAAVVGVHKGSGQSGLGPDDAVRRSGEHGHRGGGHPGAAEGRGALRRGRGEAEGRRVGRR